MALSDYLSEREAAAMPPSSENVASVASAENADATPKPAPHKDVAPVASVAPEKTKVQNSFENEALRESFGERAAILEYEAGFDRATAERMAARMYGLDEASPEALQRTISTDPLGFV